MTSKKPILPTTKLKFEIIKLSRLMATLKLLPSLVIAKNRGKKSFIPLAKLYISSTLNIDLILWHTQLIVCA